MRCKTATAGMTQHPHASHEWSEGYALSPPPSITLLTVAIPPRLS
jgi:hypothetical protein